MGMELKVIIVEDMENYIGVIEMLLKEAAPWVRVVGKATTLTRAERLIEELSPDAILLDIQFENEGKTCFDLLDSLKSRNKLNFQVVIITAHMEKPYYAKAFEYKALHYLEKPVAKDRLADAMERVRNSMVGFRMDALTNLVESKISSWHSAPQSSKIIIQGLRFNEIIDLNDIIWIDADGRKSIIYLRNDKRIVSTDNIGYFEKQLGNHQNFFRINRSEIVNISFVEKFSKKEKMVVVAGKYPNHFVSKEKFAAFLEKIKAKADQNMVTQ